MKKTFHAFLKKSRARLRHARLWGVRGWLFVGAVVVAAAIIWFYTPAPNAAARFVWDRYQQGNLALTLDRSDAPLAFEIGSYYFGNQAMIGISDARPYDLQTAARAFKEASAIAPTQPLAHYMLARIEFINSDFDAALDDLNAELALYPENKRTLYMRGLAYTYRGSPGDYAKAESDFRAFVAWAPTEWAGYNDLAFVLAKDKKYAEAVPVIQEGIARANGGATNPWLWDLLGVMQLNLNQPASALKSFLKAESLASMLTDTDWQRAYPGNNPSIAQSGLTAMQTGIEKNIVAARDALTK
ncbi:MAG: hypothetical protein WAN50_04525 [Minisyncoccia bacterium]